MAAKHVLMLVFSSILTLLKQFQFNMSDTEVGTCQCLYFKTQISVGKPTNVQSETKN